MDNQTKKYIATILLLIFSFLAVALINQILK